MSSKKTSPMWTEVKDVTRLKVGDLIIWPKETGRVKHLRGSVSTLRKLGFHIGKGCAISHLQAKFLMGRPEETKVYIVTRVQPDVTATEQADINLIKPSDASIVRYVDTCNFPMDMNVKQDEIPYSLLDCLPLDQASVIMTKEMLGKVSDYLGAHPADRYIGDYIQRILRSLNVPVLDVSTKFVSCSDMSAVVSVSGILSSCADYHDDSTIIRMNATLLVNVTSREVRIIRPSPKMKEVISANISFRANNCVMARCARLVEMIGLAMAHIKDYKKRVVRCASNARRASKRNVSTVQPALKTLTEFASSLSTKTERKENELQCTSQTW